MTENRDCSGDSELCCRDVNEFLVAYMEDGLEPHVRQRFDTHLGSCVKCNEYLEQYRTTVAMVHESDNIPAPPDVLVDRTLEFLRAHYGSAGRSRD